MSYWNQFTQEEISDMHGAEQCEIEDLDIDLVQDEIDTNSCQNECPYCSNGCNYCLVC